ncbi:hypothetical protein BJ508DRAFT_329080 [Ascobolus immersus RN42]|uniref:Uncharacterized protein n=1 Tax=Ascobolus immersus RN42 TaxID=1160509 RepID=A0A3N4HXM2_ASCIM|nr:hypothetical protein BJ508DRAFT_329080 [Ascobolus immersus RN42]
MSQAQAQQQRGFVEEAEDSRSDFGGSSVSGASNASRRRKNRRKNQKARQQQLQPINQGQALAPPPQEKKNNKDAMSLRLDINLEAELSLRVKVHGDVTLALL